MKMGLDTMEDMSLTNIIYNGKVGGLNLIYEGHHALVTDCVFI